MAGKKVVISPGWVDRVSYEESKVHVGMTRDTVRNAPEYDGNSLDRNFEAKLHAHYEKRGYWEEPQESWKLFPPTPPLL